MKLVNYYDQDNINDILIIGDLIVDSLKLEMPNEYSRITLILLLKLKLIH